MRVRELMTPKMETASPSTTLQEAALKMRNLNIGALPVWENGQLVGMITDRDICCRAVAEGLDPTMTLVQEVMSRDVAFCFSDDHISDAVDLMVRKHVRRLAVVNRSNTPAGILSVDDLAKYSRQLAGEVIDLTRPGHG